MTLVALSNQGYSKPLSKCPKVIIPMLDQIECSSLEKVVSEPLLQIKQVPHHFVLHFF